MIVYAFLYRLAVGAYILAIRLVALFNGKARLFIEGRRELLPRIRTALSNEHRPRIWMHCASLGEFEQGRPVSEALRRQYPGCAVVITFFSPSGYEVRKDYSGADYVFYLPVDTPSNAREFLDIVNPALCIFVKYEYWYYYLSTLANRNIPVLLISALFKPDQIFFKWYGGLQRKMLHCFSHLFVQDETSVELLNSIEVNDVTIAGDTRFDRVIKAADMADSLPAAAAFAAQHKVIVAGSTWPADELFLHQAMKLSGNDWKLIIVPHEVNAGHIKEVEELFAGDLVKWSEYDGMNTDKKVLLVDRVGLLLQLYKHARIAWIGGGFGKEGVHNVLEAAVYGVPCFYGPVFHQFIEAKELIEKGGGRTVKNATDFMDAVGNIDDEAGYSQQAAAARAYVLSGAGATALIMEYIQLSTVGRNLQRSATS